MSVEEHRRLAPRPLGFAVVTVSDSRTPENDAGGEKIAELVSRDGHAMEIRLLVRDEVASIREALSHLLVRDGVDVVILTGGTGFSPRDLTHEAVTPLFDREVEGFGELFRLLSFQEIGAAAMLSRATAGMVGTRAVFALPGSPQAVALAMERLVLPEAAHLLGQARRGVS